MGSELTTSGWRWGSEGRARASHHQGFSSRKNPENLGFDVPTSAFLSDIFGDRKGLSARDSVELEALAREKDPEMFLEGLLVFGQRLEDRGKAEQAAAVYAAIARHPLPGPPPSRGRGLPSEGSLLLRAQERLDAVMGRGRFGPRAEFLLKNFTKTATDYRTIVPMIAGSAVYQLSRTWALGRLAALPQATWWTRGLGANLQASLAGMSLEVPVFSLGTRALLALSGEKVRWDSESVSKDLAGAGITLGALKLSGWIGNKMGGTRTVTAPTGTFLGMLGAHRLQVALGLQISKDGATTVTDALAAMVSLGVGAHLGQRVLGKSFADFQRELAWRTEVFGKQADGGHRGAESRWGLFPKFSSESLTVAGDRIAKLSVMPDFSVLAEGPRLPVPLLSEVKDPENASGRDWSEVTPTGQVASTVESNPPVAIALPPPPQWFPRIELDSKTLERMESLPREIQETWEKEGANPVFFGLNHLKWWVGLIQRDAVETGVQALVDGGKILFGRWQEKVNSQTEVRKKIQRIAHQAKMQIHWEAPSIDAWWRPLWERKAHGGDPKLLASVVQAMRQADPELAEQWLVELALEDFDRSEQVREIAEGAPILLPKPGGPGDTRLQELTALAKAEDWRGFNALLSNLYFEAWRKSSPEETAAGIYELQQFLSTQALQVPSHSGNVPVPEISLPSPQFYDAVMIAGKARRILARIQNPPSGLSYSPETLSSCLAALGYVLRVTEYPQEAENLYRMAESVLDQIEPERAGSRQDWHQEISDFRAGRWPWTARLEPVPGWRDAELWVAEGNWKAAWSRLEATQEEHFRALLLARLVMVARGQGAVGGSFSASLPKATSPLTLRTDRPFRIGRMVDQDLRVSDSRVSRRHAEIQLKELAGGELKLTVKDLDSQNGTFLAAAKNFKLVPNLEYDLDWGKAVFFGETRLINRVPSILFGQDYQIQVLQESSKIYSLVAVLKEALADPEPVWMQFFNLASAMERAKTKVDSPLETSIFYLYLEHAFKALLPYAPPSRQNTLPPLLEYARSKAQDSLLNATISPGHNPAQDFEEVQSELAKGRVSLPTTMGPNWQAMVEGLIAQGRWALVLGLLKVPLGEAQLEHAQMMAYIFQKAADQGFLKRPFTAPKQGGAEITPVLLLSELRKAWEDPAADAVPPEVIEDKAFWIPIDPLSRFFDQLPRRDPASFPDEFRLLIPKPKDIVLFPRFERILNETAYLMTAPDRIAIRFFGPAGTFKTTIPEMIAQRMGIPLLRFPFSTRTDASDLDGTWTLEEIAGELVPVFQEGAPTIAMEYGFHLVLDEPDLARPGVLAYLNNVSAPGEYAWVRSRTGELKKIRVHEDYRVYVTENGVQEVAREEHGKDFLRRFVPYYIGPWSREETSQVIREVYENYGGNKRWVPKTTELLAYFHDTLSLLAAGYQDPATRQNLPPLGSGVGQQVVFTPRSVLRFARRLVAAGQVTPESLSRAIRAEYILPLADPADRQQIWNQAKAIFSSALMGWPLNQSVGPDLISTLTLDALSQKYLGGKKVAEGNFVWTDQMLRVADEILGNRSLGVDVMLIGEAGEGKTELPQQIAKLLDLEYRQKTMSREIEEEDLVGGQGRINGRIQFIPNIVTLVAEEGGIGHLDEYLTSDTGKLEAVMNPLMDSSRALILKNPYGVRKRHPDAFFILTSNSPFGDYADRHEASAAAMSRVAVIFLSGDFAMQPPDRLKILQAWFDRSGKKKVQSRERGLIVPATWHSSARRDAIQPDFPQKSLQVHPQLQEKFNIPAILVFDASTRKLFERLPDESTAPLSASTEKALQKYADYLTRRTQVDMVPITRKVFKILYQLRGRHSTDLGKKEIVLGLADLLEKPLGAALGVGKHEWAHATIDRPSPVYDASEVGRLFANMVGDPRMNEYVASLRKDFAEQILELNELIWPEGWREARIEKFQKLLPHEQFAYAIIYFWRHGKIMPWIESEQVRSALERALPILKPAFTLFPQSTEDAHVDAAAGEFYRILDQAHPIYQELIPESERELRKRLESGEKPEELIKQAIEFSMVLQVEDAAILLEDQPLQEIAKQILEIRAGKMADALEPQDAQAFERRKSEISLAKKGLAESPLHSMDFLPEEEPQLTASDLHSIEIERQKLLKEDLEINLYRSMVPAQAVRVANRWKRYLPPDNPAYLEGYFTTGKRLSRKKAVADAISPMPDGKVMLRRSRPGERDANLVLLSDVTYSLVTARAVDNTLRASAAGIYLAERLKLNYGEILFGSTLRIAKALDQRLQSYAKKNEVLNLKRQAFKDTTINGATNIREAMALALRWVEENRAKHNYVLLVTDGEETVKTHPKTIPQLEVEADWAGIHLLGLVMGSARIQKGGFLKHYRVVAANGSDLPDRIIELIEEVQKNRN